MKDKTEMVASIRTQELDGLLSFVAEMNAKRQVEFSLIVMICRKL